MFEDSNDEKKFLFEKTKSKRMRIVLSLLLLSSAWGVTEDVDERIESISLNKRNFDEIDDSTSSAPLTTLRDADEGVVNGECHNLGLHGKSKKKKKNKKFFLKLFFFFFFFQRFLCWSEFYCQCKFDRIGTKSQRNYKLHSSKQIIANE
jgi:hypothetical protein